MRLSRYFSLGTRLETGLFWAVIGVFVAALFTSKFLPFTDYPAHLGLAGILSRIWSGDAATKALYDTNVLSYNSLFHVVTACFAKVFSIETAGRLAVSVYFVGLPLVVMALLRELDRPVSRVFGVATFLIAFPVTWGFFNYCYGVVLGLWFIVRVIKHPYPTWRYMAVTAIVIWVGAFAHLFGMLVCATIAGCALLGRAFSEPRGAIGRLLASARSLLPFIPALIYSVYTYYAQEKGPVIFNDFAYLDGHDWAARYKLQQFFDTALSVREDHLDVRILQVAIAVLAISIPFRAAKVKRAANPMAWTMFVASLAFFILLPDVLWSTAQVFERVSLFVLIFGLVAIPRGNPIAEKIERWLLPGLALTAALLFLQIRLTQRRVYVDLDRILDDAPKNRAMTTLIRSNDLPNWTGNAIGHTGSYYVARDGGETAVHFAKYMTLPVHYWPNKRPPAAPDALAWNGANQYDVNSEYAKHFDLVLWRAWDDEPNEDPRASVWGESASDVKVLAHHGTWWLLDARPYYAQHRASLAPMPPPAPPPAPAPIETDWCEQGLTALDEETCYVLPDNATSLLVYLHGIVPPLPKSEQKPKVESIVLASCMQAGAACLVPRGVRGIGPDGAKDWYAWPTAPDSHARETKAIVAKWAAAKKKLEAIAGSEFEHTYLAGSSNGAYYLSTLALDDELSPLDFPIDGYGAMSGGSNGGKAPKGKPVPFYVGYGTYDETSGGAKTLAGALTNAGWPVKVAAHPVGHGARQVYLDEAFAFWQAR